MPHVDMKWLHRTKRAQCSAHRDAQSPVLGRALCFVLRTHWILPDRVYPDPPETQKKFREPRSNYTASARSSWPADTSSATIPQHKTFHSQKRFYEFPGVARAWQTFISSPPPTMVSGASSLSSAPPPPSTATQLLAPYRQDKRHRQQMPGSLQAGPLGAAGDRSPSLSKSEKSHRVSLTCLVCFLFGKLSK